MINIFLQYAFIQKACLAGSFTGLTCAALGLFLVLRKMSLLGDGLAHVSFGALALGLLLGAAPLYFALPAVMIASLLILKITEKAGVYADAAIGIISAIGIAAGVTLASLAHGFNVDLFSYLFGNILVVSEGEVLLAIILSLSVLAILYFFFWDLFSATYDEEFALTSGIKVGRLNALLIVLAAVTVVLSIKVVGVMLVSALLILPAAAALQLSRRFKTAIIYACGLAVFSVLAGIVFSFYLDLPTGATIVLINAAGFGLALLLRR
jgi:zinc transport system permease protein